MLITSENYDTNEPKEKTRWKADHPTRQISLLRDTKLSFPSFKRCPGEGFITYYMDNRMQEIGSMNFRWCYIGEVIERLPFFSRPGCYLKDIYNHKIMLACYLDNDGKTIVDKSIFEPGNILLIYQAFAHHFLDGHMGFRIEDEDFHSIKCIKYITMNELIE